jgi:hypothetical protein
MSTQFMPLDQILDTNSVSTNNLPIVKKFSDFFTTAFPFSSYIEPQDEIASIKKFAFPPLDELRASLVEAGYSKEEIDVEIKAFANMPEYRG